MNAPKSPLDMTPAEYKRARARLVSGQPEPKPGEADVLTMSDREYAEAKATFLRFGTSRADLE